MPRGARKTTKPEPDSGALPAPTDDPVFDQPDTGRIKMLMSVAYTSDRYPGISFSLVGHDRVAVAHEHSADKPLKGEMFHAPGSGYDTAVFAAACEKWLDANGQPGGDGDTQELRGIYLKAQNKRLKKVQRAINRGAPGPADDGSLPGV